MAWYSPSMSITKKVLLGCTGTGAWPVASVMCLRRSAASTSAVELGSKNTVAINGSFVGMVGSVVLMGVAARNVVDCLFDPRRRCLLPRLSGFYSLSPYGAVRGKVHGFGRGGAAGCFLALHNPTMGVSVAGFNYNEMEGLL